MARMSDQATRDARREELLAAASIAFARGGYFGTSTAQVARQAGVSQPYIVQYFGSKEALFVEVHERAGRLIGEHLADVSYSAFDMNRFTAAYRELMLDRELLLIVMHGFSACSVPAIAKSVRRLFASMYELLTERAGATPEQARDFMARGILMNTVLTIGITEHLDESPWVRPLLEAIGTLHPDD